MMYQFQRSFIKAASECAGVRGTGLKEERGSRVTAPAAAPLPPHRPPGPEVPESRI